MINVNRSPTPASLQRPEIKTYLEEVAKYNSLSADERKSAQKPDAGSYRAEDVLEVLGNDFHSKCYLTEQKFANAYAMDIEHFKSKAFGQHPALKYEWTNLYPCSHDANMLKPRIDPEGGYLDPCSSDDDVETAIVYTLGFNGEASFDAYDEQNSKARNTALLLDKVHNGGTDRDAKMKTATLRLYINKKADELKELIMDWQSVKGNQEEEIRASRKIKNLLSRESDFTMLLRSLSCVKKHVPKEFLD